MLGVREPPDQLGAGGDVELAVDAAQVELHRLVAEGERGPDLLVRLPLGDPQRDLELLRRRLLGVGALPAPELLAAPRLRVSKSGKVTGSGTYTVLQTGDGPVMSKITAVARITFTGTATDGRYAGKQVVTMQFGDIAHSDGNTITRDVSGKLVIT